MPKVKVAIWNIQDFGSNKPYKRGANSLNLCKFISAFMYHKEIDVLAIMEVRPTAQPSLNNLRLQLNALRPAGAPLWEYDWIKGSTIEDDPVRSDDLSWSSGQGGIRPEGYALFWKNGDPNFTVMDAMRDISEGVRTAPPVQHKLDLVTHGLQYDVGRNNDGRIGWGVRQGFLENRRHPQLGNEPGQWHRLNFISVAHNAPADPRLRFTRRPAFTVLRLNGAGGGAGTLCPLLYFHAPSRTGRSDTATLVSGLSRELFVAPQRIGGIVGYNYATTVIAGGDYNLAMGDGPDDTGKYYGRYTRKFRSDTGGGAQCKIGLLPQGMVRTTVQLNEKGKSGLYNGKKITGDTVGAYLKSTIDQMFYRHPAGITVDNSEVVDLVSLVKDPPDSLRDAIKVFLPLLDRAVEYANAHGGRIEVRGRGPILANGSAIYEKIWHWTRFRGGVTRGSFQNSTRAAAEFIHIFISDHLPLTLQMNW